MNARILVFILFTIGMCNIASASLVAPPESPWPMFGHDPQHTGRSPYAGPESANLQWSYVIAGNFHLKQSPVIAPDGTIYVPADGVFAFNPNGSLKWYRNPVGGVII